MSKKTVDRRGTAAHNNGRVKDSRKLLTRKRWFLIGTFVFASLIVLGVFADKGWLESKEKTAKPVAKNASSSWNPLAAPSPTPTPQLSKELIYAGSGRLLAVVDANAQEAPPADLAVWRPSTGGWWILGS